MCSCSLKVFHSAVHLLRGGNGLEHAHSARTLGEEQQVVVAVAVLVVAQGEELADLVQLPM
eukprot:6214537-Pleurochrysis_carterae.AAC.1